MLYNSFDSLKISRLGFGGMRLPETADGKIEYEQSQKMVDLAIKSGVNYFDTAFMYHDGESEVFYGDTLTKYPRDSYLLADKMPAGSQKCRDDLEKVFATQLERCKTDYFDFYLMHSVTSNSYDEFFLANNVIDFCLEKKRSGKIRHFGFSFHGDAELLDRVLRENDCFEFVQLQLNYYDFYKDDAKQVYETARKYNMPIIIMEPVRGGLLARLNESGASILTQYNPSLSLASWAIRYAMNLDGVVTVLSGMSDLSQVEDNLSSADLPDLSDADYDTINKAVAAFCKEAFLPCTGCRYCMDCPNGIDIPDLFKRRNCYSIEGEWSRGIMREKYAELEHKAEACKKCGLCSKHCPQGIDIPAELEVTHKLLTATK